MWLLAIQVNDLCCLLLYWPCALFSLNEHERPLQAHQLLGPPVRGLVSCASLSLYVSTCLSLLIVFHFHSSPPLSSVTNERILTHFSLAECFFFFIFFFHWKAHPIKVIDMHGRRRGCWEMENSPEEWVMWGRESRTIGQLQSHRSWTTRCWLPQTTDTS